MPEEQIVEKTIIFTPIQLYFLLDALDYVQLHFDKSGQQIIIKQIINKIKN